MNSWFFHFGEKRWFCGFNKKHNFVVLTKNVILRFWPKEGDFTVLTEIFSFRFNRKHDYPILAGKHMWFEGISWFCNFLGNCEFGFGRKCDLVVSMEELDLAILMEEFYLAISIWKSNVMVLVGKPNVAV